MHLVYWLCQVANQNHDPILAGLPDPRYQIDYCSTVGCVSGANGSIGWRRVAGECQNMLRDAGTESDSPDARIGPLELGDDA